MLLVASEVPKAATDPATDPLPLDSDDGDVDEADGKDTEIRALLLLLLLERLVLLFALLACLERFSF